MIEVIEMFFFLYKQYVYANIYTSMALKNYIGWLSAIIVLSNDYRFALLIIS